MKITVHTLSSKTIEVDCADTDTVGHLKDRIHRLEGIPPDMQRLIFRSPTAEQPKRLEGGGRLTDLGIQDRSSVHLGIELGRRGRFMGWKIVDAADKVATLRTSSDYADDDPFDEGLTIVTVPESYEISLWRECVRGFNYEGACTNASCTSFNKSVIRWCTSGTFDPFRDFDCPTCKGAVKPTGCGFYDCVRKLEGVNKSDGSYFSTPWKEARGERLHRLQRDGAFKADEWQDVRVVVWPIAYPFNDKQEEGKLVETADDVCAICWSKVTQGTEGSASTTACGHHFHAACCNEWAKWCSATGLRQCCSVCRENM